MKRIKAIVVITALAMLVAMMPVMSFASTSAPAKVKNVNAYQSAYGYTTYVKWSKVSNADGYQVARKVEGGTYKVVKTITKGSTVKYASGKLTLGKTYYYKVRAYKKSGSKKIYGSYSDVDTVKVCYLEPKYYRNEAITNEIIGDQVVTTFNITINEKCKTVYLSNKSDAVNSVIRTAGMDKAKYDRGMEIIDELLDGVENYEAYADKVLKDLAGEYYIYTSTPETITVDGTEVAAGKTKALYAGNTYTIKFASSYEKMIPTGKLVIGTDENDNAYAEMKYCKQALTEMYSMDFSENWKTQGTYILSLRYWGDDYTATMSWDYDEDDFVKNIEMSWDLDF